MASAWQRRSVRFRITALAAAATAGVLLGTGLFVVTDHRSRLTDQVDDLVDQRAEDITALLEEGEIPVPLPNEPGRDSLAQLVAEDGTVLSASRNMQGRPALPYRPGEGTDPAVRTVDGVPIEDDDFRVLSQRLRLPDGDFGILHVAVEFEVDESAESLIRTLAIVFPTVLAILAALIWAVVGRALRPVEAIRTEVASIGATALDRRVPAPPGNDEIARLAGTMNAMLERVEASHRRQQQFVADAAHELRSPLTSIRSELEVDLANPAGADHEATQRSVLEEAERLSRLVDSLLFLAKADAGEDLRVVGTVDLDEIVLRESRALRLRGAVAVDTSAVSGAQLSGDADQLTRAVRNLLDNAGRHARSTVTVSLSEAEAGGGGGVTLVVADDGPGVPAGLADRIFERFVRVDDARSRDHGGAGLGLAITREIVHRHGGTIALDGEGAGARFVVRFPAP